MNVMVIMSVIKSVIILLVHIYVHVMMVTYYNLMEEPVKVNFIALIACTAQFHMFRNLFCFVNLFFLLKCYCFDSFLMLAIYVLDINECQTDNGGCTQTCINTDGSYRCSCQNGYQLTSDGRNCTIGIYPCVTVL